MDNSHDVISIDWVRQHIEQVLRQAETDLTLFLEEGLDAGSLQACRDSVHQVHGSLKIVELAGAATLTESLERLLNKLLDGSIEGADDTWAVIAYAFVSLPHYLNTILKDGQEKPILLIDIINDVRHVMGEKPLLHYDFVDINLKNDLPCANTDIQHAYISNAQPNIKKIRQAFQFALIKLIRKDDIKNNLTLILNALNFIKQHTDETRIHCVWHISVALVEGLINGSIKLTPAIVELLRKIDGEIKQLVASGVDGLNYRPENSLLKHMLYLIATCEDDEPNIQAIKNAYHLSELPLNIAAEQIKPLNEPDALTIEAVVKLLKGELDSIKDVIDLYVRNDDNNAIKLNIVKPKMQQVASILALLNLDVLHSVIIEQINNLVKCSDTSEVLLKAMLLKMAEDLLLVETGLDNLIGQSKHLIHENRGAYSVQATEAVITAVIDNLHTVKEAAHEFMANCKNDKYLEPVPILLHEAAGGLFVISLNTAGNLLSSVAQHIGDNILARKIAPTMKVLNTLAEIVSRVENYLNLLVEGQKDSSNDLCQAQDGIANLGYPVDQMEGIVSDIGKLTDTLCNLHSNEHITPSITNVAPVNIVIDAPIDTTLNASTTVELDDDEQEIIEIFVEEASEVFAFINQYWPIYTADNSNNSALENVRRSFHTLKGSGRMVHAGDFAELACSIENVLNKLLDGIISSSVELTTLVNQVISCMPSLLEQFKAQQPYNDVNEFIEHANSIADGQSYDAVDITVPTQDEPPAIIHELSENNRQELHNLFVEESNEHLDAISAFLDKAKKSTIFIPISDALLRTFHTLKGSAYTVELTNVGDIASALEKFTHTLRERTINASTEVQELLIQSQVLLSEAIGAANKNIKNQSDDHQQFIAKLDKFLQSNACLEGQPLTASAYMIAIQDSMEAVCKSQELFEQWQLNPKSNAELLGELIDVLHKISKDAAVFDEHPLKSLTEVLADNYINISNNHIALNDVMLDALIQAHEGMLIMVDQSVAGMDIDSATSLVGLLKQAMTVLPDTVKNTDINHVIDNSLDIDLVDDQDKELIDIFIEEAEEIIEAVSDAQQNWIHDTSDLDAVDALKRSLHTLKGGARMAGMVGIGDLSHTIETIYQDISLEKLGASKSLFALLDECDDRLVLMLNELKAEGQCTHADDLVSKLKAFSSGDMHHAKDQASVSDSALYTEHTIVSFDTDLGGSVQGDAQQLEEFFNTTDHALVALFEHMEQLTKNDIDHESCYLKISQLVAVIGSNSLDVGIYEIGDLCRIFREVLENLQPIELLNVDVQQDLAQWIESIKECYLGVKKSAAKPVATRVVTKPVIPIAASKKEKLKDASSTQNKIRVSSALLENLVDLAGETSVSRLHVEQQINDCHHLISEVGSTVNRLREQLKQLDRETEAQILFRQDSKGPEHAGFDNLEMDRYSRIQELSGGLAESVSDLLDLNETLEERARYTDNLLLAQSRIHTELQEGLMKARMEPFSKIVPRLRRLVRKIGSEVGKNVELRVKNAEAEMDRVLLEHIVAPFEHMLRNAVDHGIESATQRQKMNKPEQGIITLSCDRDGSDVVLKIVDDGAGIDVNAVRAKAVERGLMNANATLSDREIMQFILHAGFSTATSVTQLSGRGVGMDVACSEIKKLNGSIEIDSEFGKGCIFTIRLPFTVTINRVLMITIGDDTYALPLNSIEGVLRVSPYELEEYYKKDGPKFEYLGQSYELNYLGEYLGLNNNLHMKNQSIPLPVLLVRANNKTVAIQVDSISGSKEIVVKSLGAPLSVITGVSGATILGDGRVVLILDLAAMVRSTMVAKHNSEINVIESIKVSESLQVMVVDDSVTVRKVASRILQRHGMDVITAKDGIEAINKLQDVLPDIMLLDIEMPRMDGFELAALMRHDDRLKDVPIIMITSRVGQKHRDRARDIGVNQFMGKPFQETALLHAIAGLTSFEFLKAE